MRLSIAIRSSRLSIAEAREQGFTLLEIVLGMAILGLIVSGIYAVAMGTVELSNAVSESQNEEIRLHNFLRLLRRNFERVPGNAGVTMMPVSGGGFTESDIVFYNYPLAFYWPSVPAGSARVVLMSKKSSRGGMDVGLLYLDEEAPEDFRSSMGGGLGGSANGGPGLWLNLLSEVTMFQWTFFDETLGEAGEWVELWEDPEKRPGIVRLELLFYGQGLDEKVESIFWIPNMVNPEQLASQGQQQGGVGGAGRGQGGPGAGRSGQGGGRGGGADGRGPANGAGGRGAGNAPPGAGRGGGGR
ncbi:MAG: prepilin-type N-terminal cleavage/methylation domain-containing protein [Verrucomicrobiales bacterium]|jgi:prepilin-type N-terminal cleavage/methylation domain-containing protein